VSDTKGKCFSKGREPEKKEGRAKEPGREGRREESQFTEKEDWLRRECVWGHSKT
jgi:hypothetical protein